MRHLFAFVFLVLHLQPAVVEAQSLSSLSLTQNTDGTFRLLVHTMFFAGDGQIHIQESIGHDTTYQNDTLKFRLFYPLVAGFAFTDYVDTFNLGYIAPNSVSVFTLYRLSAHEVSPNVWDTIAFSEPFTDTSLLFPWVASVNENELFPRVRLYPNPVITDAFIALDGDNAGVCTIEILDQFGGRLFHCEEILGVKPVRLDMNGYSKGVYFICITDERWRRKVIKVIKK